MERGEGEGYYSKVRNFIKTLEELFEMKPTLCGCDHYLVGHMYGWTLVFVRYRCR